MYLMIMKTTVKKESQQIAIVGGKKARLSLDPHEVLPFIENVVELSKLSAHDFLTKYLNQEIITLITPQTCLYARTDRN